MHVQRVIFMGPFDLGRLYDNHPVLNKMKLYSNIQILVFTWMVFVFAMSCADIDTETSGYASLQIIMDGVIHRKASRSKLAPSMTHSDANTILAVLVPAVQCDVSTASSGDEYSRALVDTSSHKAHFVVPLETQVKLCLYFFRDTFSLNDLGGGDKTTESLLKLKLIFPLERVANFCSNKSSSPDI